MNMDDQVRLEALNAALGLNSDWVTTAEQLIAEARKIEAYLRGDDTTPTDDLTLTASETMARA